MKIYCIIHKGAHLQDEVADVLFREAQRAIRAKERHRKIADKTLCLSGEISTTYKAGMMGAIVGIIFHANFEWEGGTTKTDFIVRPTRNELNPEYCRWSSAPLFPANVANN